MKLRMICAAAMLAVAVNAPAARASVFTDSDPQKKVEREQDLYEEATDAYDDHDWRRASKEFARVADMRGSHADAALFWLAKSQNNLGLRSEALSTVVQLRTQFPKSKWNDDAKALEIEVRQSAGQKIDPHVSGGVSVVHNGIIENHEEMRARLRSLGYEFASDTDTEVIAHLVHSFLAGNKDLFQAVRAATRELSHPESSLAQRGRTICQQITAATATPTYYRLYRYGARSEAQERKRRFPICNGARCATSASWAAIAIVSCSRISMRQRQMSTSRNRF